MMALLSGWERRALSALAHVPGPRDMSPPARATHMGFLTELGSGYFSICHLKQLSDHTESVQTYIAQPKAPPS